MKLFYALGRLGRDLNALRKGKLLKRLANKAIGRYIVSKLWIR